MATPIHTCPDDPGHPRILPTESFANQDSPTRKRRFLTKELAHEVLVITDKFAPHPGGTAVCWTEWVRRWPSRRTRVLTTRFPNGGGPDDLGINVRRVPFFDIPKLRMPLLWLTLALGTFWLILQDRPKIIHCGQILETGWIGLICKKLFGIPYVVHLYGEEIRIHASRKFTASLQNKILREASGVSAITVFTRELLHRHTDYQGPVALAYPGVDLTTFHPTRADRFPRPTLLTVARLMKRKGHELVLEAVSSLRDEYPDLTYLVVGSGPHLDQLRQKAEHLGLEGCVRFLGSVSQTKIVELMNQCHLFVHPNRELPSGDVEGFGIVFLEASACGLPVIGGRSGGTPEAISEGVSGHLITPESKAELVTTIRDLLTNETRWMKMSAAGPEWASRFSWSHSANTLWELTRQIGGLADASIAVRDGALPGQTPVEQF